MQDFINDLKKLALSSENPDFKRSNESWHNCIQNSVAWLREFKPKFVRNTLLDIFKEDGFYSAGYFPEDIAAVESFILENIGGIVTSKVGHTIIESGDFVFVITNVEDYYNRIVILSHKEF